MSRIPSHPMLAHHQDQHLRRLVHFISSYNIYSTIRLETIDKQQDKIRLSDVKILITFYTKFQIMALVANIEVLRGAGNACPVDLGTLFKHCGSILLNVGSHPHSHVNVHPSSICVTPTLPTSSTSSTTSSSTSSSMSSSTSTTAGVPMATQGGFIGQVPAIPVDLPLQRPANGLSIPGTVGEGSTPTIGGIQNLHKTSRIRDRRSISDAQFAQALPALHLLPDRPGVLPHHRLPFHPEAPFYAVDPVTTEILPAQAETSCKPDGPSACRSTCLA